MLTVTESITTSRFGTGYDELLSFTPDVNNVNSKNFYIFQLPFGVLLLILVAFCGTLIWQYFNSSSFVKLYPQFSKLQRFKLVLWCLQLISSVSCLIVLFVVLKPCILWNGTLFTGLVTGKVDFDWKYQLSWLDNLNDLWIFLGWGVFPSMFVYLFEITPIGPYAPRTPIHLHHFTVILTVLYGIKAFISTYDATWIQMGIVLYFHIILEIPIWIALLSYRLDWKNSSTYLGLATIFEAGLRLTLWITSFLIYAKLCWLRFTYTPWEIIWRIAYPIICIMLVFAQVLTIQIHYQLYCRSVMKKKQLLSSKSEIEPRNGAMKTKKEAHSAISYEWLKDFLLSSIYSLKNKVSSTSIKTDIEEKDKKELELAAFYPIDNLEAGESFQFQQYRNKKDIIEAEQLNTDSFCTAAVSQDYAFPSFAINDTPYYSSQLAVSDLTIDMMKSTDELLRKNSDSLLVQPFPFPSLAPENEREHEENDDTVGMEDDEEEMEDIGFDEENVTPIDNTIIKRKVHFVEDGFRSPPNEYSEKEDEETVTVPSSPDPLLRPARRNRRNQGNTSNSNSFHELISRSLSSVSSDTWLTGSSSSKSATSSSASSFITFDSFFHPSSTTSIEKEERTTTVKEGKKPGERTKTRTFFFGIKSNTLTYWLLYSLFIPFFILLFGSNMFTSEQGYYSEVSKGQRIAVIGGGISGLSTVWSLSKHPQNFPLIDLYEKQDVLGGAAQAFYYNDPTGKESQRFIDEGFSQFNNHYANFLSLLNHLNVSSTLNYVYWNAIFPNITSVEEKIKAVKKNSATQSLKEEGDGSGEEGEGRRRNRKRNEEEVLKEENSGELLTLARSLYSNSTISTYVKEINRFNQLLEIIIETWTEEQLMTTTLGDFMKQYDFSNGFIYRYMPICLQLYVASSVDSFNIPIVLFYYMENIFKACLTLSSAQGRHLTNGTTNYIESLTKDIMKGDNVFIHLNTSITAIRIQNPKSLTSKGTVMLLTSHGEWKEYDQIVFATFRKSIHSIYNHPLSMICPENDYLMPKETCSSLYNTILDDHDVGTSLYSVVHSDTDFMNRVFHRLQDDEGCWNYQHYNFYSLMDYESEETESTTDTDTDSSNSGSKSDLNKDAILMNTQSLNSIHIQLPYTKMNQ
jgi:hypothetical protein